ncbi:type VII secretion target [Actinoplanes sp. NPDC023714]|uniref:type VII secretion target n=1 Tax=Actinoplanes sp. NPDC023714 TaxID=3154322 RepID=UPI0033D1CBAF
MFRLDVDAVQGHARMVDGVAEMLDAVTAAVGHLQLHSEVYGEWPGPFITGFLGIAQEQAIQDMRSGTDATSHLADLLRSLTADIALTDDEAARELREAGP